MEIINNLNERKHMNFPEPNEYAAYYSGYIKNIPPDANIIEYLENGRDALQSLISSIPEAKGIFSYAEGKWSIKEVFGHLADSERIFAYRALCIARKESKSLPGFEQDDYVREANFNNRSFQSFADELLHLRNSNISLFKSFNAAELLSRGVANNKEFSVRAFLYIIAGHEIHHLKILKEKYGI
ncbi:MAG TPA: DinB family protein [Ignavibacteriaceae bacterium]|nr:DinB family protein [Ignavibacteriaceae bacterium]